MTTPTPRTVRLRSGIETINGITGETSPTYSEYVLLEDYQRDLAAVREELAQERERAERAEQKLADERAMHGLTIKRAERAEARAEAAEKDAGRYRWLRDESWKGINGTFAARWCLVANRGAGLDAAIDAAIAEGTP